MHHYRKYLASFVLFLSTAIFAGFAGAMNLVTNEGMEASNADFTGWRTLSYTKENAEFKLETAHARSGTNSVSVRNMELTDSRLVQSVSVKEDTKYRFAAWVKTDGVSREGKGANLSIENHWIGSREMHGTTNEWELLELYFTTGAGIKTLEVGLRVGGIGAVSTGKAYFDDVVLEEISRIPPDAPAYIANTDSMIMKPEVPEPAAIRPLVVQGPVPPYSQFIVFFALLVATVAVYCVLLFVKPRKSGKQG